MAEEELKWDTDFEEADPGEEVPVDDFEDIQTEKSPYDVLFNAPDYAAIVKKTRSKTAREYEVKVQSMFKAVTIGALKRGDLPDAAAFLAHGPAFAKAAGDLTDESDAAKRAIDMLTAPDSPWFVFGLAALTLGGQLYRNHQAEIQATSQNVKKTWKERREAKKNGIPQQQATTTVKLPFGRKVTLRFKVRIPVLGAIFRGLSQTSVPPQALVYSVFSDAELRSTLKRQGIIIAEGQNGEV